jgi:hypothetical protein
MKVKFELGTRESETLIREELRIEDLSKRIQEQNEYALRPLLENRRKPFGPSLIHL